MFFFCFIAEFINGNYAIAEKYSQLIRRVPPELISVVSGILRTFLFD